MSSTTDSQRYINTEYGPIGRIIVSLQGNPAPGQALMLENTRAATLDSNHILAVLTSDGVTTFFVTLAPDVRSDLDLGQIVEEVDDVEPMTARPIARLWKLVMLCNTSSSSRPVPMVAVYYASREGVDFALGMNRIPLESRVPIGVLLNGDGQVHPVNLHAEYFLGQQAVHINWVGISGLAAKTSKKSLCEHGILMHRKTLGLRCAVVVFASKGSDELFRDLPADSRHEFWRNHPDLLKRVNPNSFLTTSNMDDKFSDEALYTAMGLPMTPFESVRIFVPCGDDQWWGYRTPETNNNLGTAEIFGFEWGLRQVAPYMSLFASSDGDDKFKGMEAEVLHTLREGYWVLNEETKKSQKLFIHTLADLKAFFEDIDEHIDKNRWHGHHAETIARTRARYLDIFRRASQVVSPGIPDPKHSFPLDQLRDGMLWVVDVSQLAVESKTLVIYKIISELYEMMQGNRLPLDRLIFDVDELNQLAPRRPNSPQAKITTSKLQDISERARTDGTILFTAQQTLSDVDDRVQSNFGTLITGTLGNLEAREAVYAFNEIERFMVGQLEPGEAFVKHHLLRHRIKVRVPRPPFLRGKEGQRLLKPLSPVNIADRLLRILAGAEGRVVPSQNQMSQLVQSFLGAGGTMGDLKSAAEQVRWITPLENERNTAQATINLFKKILSQQSGIKI